MPTSRCVVVSLRDDSSCQLTWCPTQIAATDKGPKVLSLGTAGSNGYNSFDVSISAWCAWTSQMGR
mgnify:CR=1 FL=1